MNITTNTPQPRRTKVCAIRGATNASLVKTKLNAKHYAALLEAKDALAAASGSTFSATVILRRACERYCRELAELRPEALALEARVLALRFR